MGSFVFKWDHPAEEVYVTGTFDDWSKSEKLVKTGDSFSKDVTLNSAAEKIYYKVREEHIQSGLRNAGIPMSQPKHRACASRVCNFEALMPPSGRLRKLKIFSPKHTAFLDAELALICGMCA
ncbi:hypothetical protein BKA64DRAFT_432657 [Cadophora sp. MPI-SDFR-AT-0126]|nr:hypothetical protein BKA64DRAFT_432657 [Leotiomycetes sp. MPI-SDFR-AT-0126]